MPQRYKSGITAVILTKNEEKNIVSCIESVSKSASRIVVVDSGSTDRTVEIALSFGADVFEHGFEDYSKQFNWAIDNTDIDTIWTYRIDADETVTPELAAELLRETTAHENDDVSGMVMKFRVYFMGRFLKHGGVYPFYNLTVFKTGKGRYTERKMGEHVVLSEGETLYLKNDCIHNDFKDLTAWTAKHNWYSLREAGDYFDVKSENEKRTLYREADKTKRLREGFYYRLPRFFRAKLYYWYRYYLKLGFLDGTEGRIYAFLQAYWYRYLTDARIYECEKYNRNPEYTGSLKY